MIVQESISASISEDGYVHIEHVQIRRSGIDMGGAMWFARDNLAWVIATLDACLNTYAFSGAQRQHDHDALDIFESGPEQAPFINLQNRRHKQAPHGGVYSLPMSKPTAKSLHTQLVALS